MLGVQHGVGENPFIRFISGIKNRENTSIFTARFSISFMHLNVHKYQGKYAPHVTLHVCVCVIFN